VERLERALAISVRDELDASWAVRPRAMATRDGCPALHLEDPGGEPLSRFARPWNVGAFLRVAVGLASATRRLHERGLVHRDIKPENVLVDVATGKAWLSGFGTAIRAPRGHQRADAWAPLVGTLPYMSPELTGSVNRPVDARSDLYSIGVVFHEMLSGNLPFVAVTPKEWVHSHVARPAPPLGNPVPPPLAAIVPTLLAKAPSERYQSAFGLEADLRRCLRELESLGRIEAFVLAEHESWDKLVVSTELYGRRGPSARLRAAFDRIALGDTELVLVSGYSGIGKSSLVEDLMKAIAPSSARLARGKVDQYKRDIPAEIARVPPCTKQSSSSGPKTAPIHSPRGWTWWLRSWPVSRVETSMPSKATSHRRGSSERVCPPRSADTRARGALLSAAGSRNECRGSPRSSTPCVSAMGSLWRRPASRPAQRLERCIVGNLGCRYHAARA
jgi:energy-coupling factor transporter ATP-binding protein EcfA2